MIRPLKLPYRYLNGEGGGGRRLVYPDGRRVHRRRLASFSLLVVATILFLFRADLLLALSFASLVLSFNPVYA